MRGVARGRDFRVVVYAGTRAWEGAYCRYIVSTLEREFPALKAVLIENESLAFRRARAMTLLRRWRRRGTRRTVAELRDRRLRQVGAAEVSAVANRVLTAAGAPVVPPDVDTTRCRTVNGRDAEAAIRSCDPDVVIQIGAGILKPNIFRLGRIGTLNVHHGYLPVIRGADSILWALYHGRREWIGVSVHMIDAGIDTGPILARHHFATDFGVHPGELYGSASVVGGELLVEQLHALAGGNPPQFIHDAREGEYRSFFPGASFACLKKNNWYPVDPDLPSALPAREVR